MAITTPDQYVAAVAASSSRVRPFWKNWPANNAAGVPISLWYMNGAPGAATVPSSGMSGATCSVATPGALPLWTPTNTLYLTAATGTAMSGSTTGGVLMLVDRLWEQSGIVVTTTTAQTVNSVAWPARDENMATAGDGIYIGIEVSTATTNASAITNMTLDYTNSSGVASRVGRVSSFPANAKAGVILVFALDDGDQGVRSIQGITLGTSLVTGVVNLFAFRLLTTIGEDNWSNGGTSRSGLSVALPILGGASTQACIQGIVIPQNTAIGTAIGLFGIAEG